MIWIIETTLGITNIFSIIVPSFFDFLSNFSLTSLPPKVAVAVMKNVHDLTSQPLRFVVAVMKVPKLRSYATTESYYRGNVLMYLTYQSICDLKVSHGIWPLKWPVAVMKKRCDRVT